MKRIISAALMLVAMSASADNPPLSKQVFDNGTMIGTLCSAQTATSTGCTGGSNGDELVGDFRGYTSVVFYATQSSATSYTCDVYTSDNGYDADSGVGQDRSSTSLTETQQAIVLDGALGFAWIECSAMAGGNVTITFVARK